MITIYKNNYKVNMSAYVLCFSFSEDVTKRIDNWRLDLDKMVVDEQIATGSFNGRFRIRDDQRSMMKDMQKEGVIQPYYGAIGGACSYTLQIIPPLCTISVEFTEMEKKISFDENMTIILKAKASKITLNQNRKFMIEKDQYLSLKKWDLWNEDDQFTSRYSYKFSPTSIGDVIKVTETLTKNQIDISNYDNW